MNDSNLMSKLLEELKPLSQKYIAVTNEESNAIKAAQFAGALSLHDTKIQLHKKLFAMLEQAKNLQKNDAQKEELSQIITDVKASATDNKSALEAGFGAIERLVGRILGVMKAAVEKEVPNYTRGGSIYKNPHKSLSFQTDKSI